MVFVFHSWKTFKVNCEILFVITDQCEKGSIYAPGRQRHGTDVDANISLHQHGQINNFELFSCPEKKPRFVKDIYVINLSAVLGSKLSPDKYMARLGPFTSYHNQNDSDNRSASVTNL